MWQRGKSGDISVLWTHFYFFFLEIILKYWSVVEWTEEGMCLVFLSPGRSYYWRYKYVAEDQLCHHHLHHHHIISIISHLIIFNCLCFFFLFSWLFLFHFTFFSNLLIVYNTIWTNVYDEHFMYKTEQHLCSEYWE